MSTIDPEVATERERCRRLVIAFAADLFGVQDGDTWTIQAKRRSDVESLLEDIDKGGELTSPLQYNKEDGTITEEEP